MPYLTFEKDLKKLGLSDKESAVYLAAMGLGASPVQPISRKAKVARATTYLVLDSLMEKGLVTKYTEGEKSMYIVEPPRQLQLLLEQQERTLKERQQELNQLLPKLQAYLKSTDDRPVVRYYAGVEGIRAMRGEMVMNSRSGDVWHQMAPADHMYGVFGNDNDQASYVTQRKVKRIHSKAIISVKSPELKASLEKTSDDKWAERRFVSPERYKSASSMTVLPTGIVIASFSGKVGGTLIESESAAEMMRELFTMAWNSLES